MSDGFPTQEEATITIYRAEYERLRDAERVAWCLRRGATKAVPFMRIDPLWPDTVFFHGKTKTKPSGHFHFDEMPDPARAIIDAAMEKGNNAK